MTTAALEPRSGEQIQAALRAFVSKWKAYAGTERSEAQTYLNELFACYGTDRHGCGARFEDFAASAGFMDLHWPEICIIEMKAPSRAKRLHEAREQVMRYWQASADPDTDRRAARYVVLCAFQRFEIWEPGGFPMQPRVSFDIEELPDRYETLLFLAPTNLPPSFADHYRELTAAVSVTVAQLYQSLKDRAAAPLDEVQRFIMQSVWAMFAEDLGMLEGFPLQNLVEVLRKDPTRSSATELGYLFRLLNQKGNHNRKGLFAGTKYVNGDLFRDPAEVHLEPAELTLLADAAAHDWRKVNPTIFGSLMEGVLGADRRSELGAHYTHEVDILKIVEPTIVRPWQERIDALSSPAQGRDLLDELCSFTVLDPACGCGNFLYVAYRELRSIEHQLKTRIAALAREQGLPVPPGPWPYYPLRNLHGLEIERVAVLIARVTLWMGHRQMIDRYGEAEPVLPLVDLSGIAAQDALRSPWPQIDCIIGNPPFHGASRLRAALGNQYVDWLKATYGVGIKDHCVYWFRKAHDHLQPGQRAGLVGTNSVSQNQGRSASLQYIIDHDGTITDAISSQKWPGEAKVHVSLVNWIKDGSATGSPLLDGVPVPAIGPDLRAYTSGQWDPVVLPANAGRCFEGPSPKAKGFLISAETADNLLSDPRAPYVDVVRPYLTANDITDEPEQRPSRWIIDFALMPLEEASKYPAALAIVRDLVRPVRESNNRKAYRDKWWQFAEPRRALRAALETLPRFVATPRHAKRALFVWYEPPVLASDATDVFTFDDDFSMGVLQSRPHVAWAWHRGSTIKADLRYTPTTVFMTFPWPDRGTAQQRTAVAEAGRQLLTRRDAISSSDKIGLTALYNAMDEGAYADLKALHRRLDAAVAVCYGWPAKIAQDDRAVVARLLDLNQQIAQAQREYAPFA